MQPLGDSDWAEVEHYITKLQNDLEEAKHELSSPVQTHNLERQHYQPTRWPALISALYIGGLLIFSLGVHVLFAAVAAAFVALIAAIAAWPRSVRSEMFGRDALDVSKYVIAIAFLGVITMTVSWAYLATLTPGSLWVLAFSGFAFLLIPAASYKFLEERESAEDSRLSDFSSSNKKRQEIRSYIDSMEAKIRDLFWAREAYVAGGDEARESADILASCGFYELAGKIRDMQRREKRSTYVRTSTVDVNKLLDQVGVRGLAVPYKCPSCGHGLSHSELKSNQWECAYCGGALSDLLDFLKGALGMK